MDPDHLYSNMYSKLCVLFLALVDEACQDSLEQMFEIPLKLT